MQKAIIGKKVGMTQIFDAEGRVIPVTVIEAGPCSVIQKKTVERDGYEAVQLGFMDKADKNVNKPQAGHFKKAGISAKRVLKEFKLEGAAEMNVGDEVKAVITAIDFDKKRVSLSMKALLEDAPAEETTEA